MAGRDTLQGTSVGMLVPNMELGRRFRPVGVLLPNLETRRCQTRKLCRRYWACGSAAAKYGNCRELLWEGRCQTWNSAAGSGLLECCCQIWKLPNLDNRPPVLGLWESCCQIWKLQGTSVGRPVPNMELGRRIWPVGVLLPNLETRRCQIWKLGCQTWKLPSQYPGAGVPSVRLSHQPPGHTRPLQHGRIRHVHTTRCQHYQRGSMKRWATRCNSAMSGLWKTWKVTSKWDYSSSKQDRHI